jgi:hypothetical protein
MLGMGSPVAGPAGEYTLPVTVVVQPCADAETEASMLASKNVAAPSTEAILRELANRRGIRLMVGCFWQQNKRTA